MTLAKAYNGDDQSTATRWIFAGLMVLLCVIAAPLAKAADVKAVRLYNAPDHTRLVLDVSRGVSHKIFPLTKPHRLVIDISDSRMKANLAKVDLKGSPVKRLRSARKKDGVLRVVLDLDKSVNPRSFTLKPNQHYGHRLVVDLNKKSKAKSAAVVQKKVSSKNQRDVVIAIDAGHGGEDPGAIGPKRLKEKDVNLSIAKRLAKKINGQKGYKAVLVRTGDYYVQLKKRRDIARKNRADLFISIHADGFKDKRANGASVFALSRRGATSEMARYLAQHENESDLIGGVGDVNLEDHEDMVKGVLVDLSMTATLTSSLDAGGKVLNELGGVAQRLHKKHVEQAGFAVLKRPDIPSILVETGFISNPKEARLLSGWRYQEKIASAVFRGVKSYFWSAPPEGSYLAWKKNGGKATTVVASTKSNASSTKKSTRKPKVVVINRGDTLSAIAEKYGVSVASLLRTNGLKNSTIRIGQKLKIPTS